MAREQVESLAHSTFIMVAAIGAAVFFAFIWEFTNHEVTFIGEGFDSPGACFAAGLVCWIWVFRQTKLRRDESGLSLIPNLYKWIAINFAIAPFSIFTGRVVFSFIPPWDNSIGAVLGLLIGYAIARAVVAPSKRKVIPQRGATVLTEPETQQRIQRLSRGSEPRLRWAGMDLPGEVAYGNFVVAGAVGTGKTRMHRELMASVLPQITAGSDRRAIVYDVKSDLIAELQTMGVSCPVHILNPYDRRSVKWSIAHDVNTPSRSRQFAEAFIPLDPEQKDKFFVINARAVIAGVIDMFNRNAPGIWTLRDLINVTANRRVMEALLAETRLLTQLFNTEITLANFINEIAAVTTSLDPVAALWERTPEPPFSLRDWVARGDSIVVLAGNDANRATLQAINRVMLKMIKEEFFAQRESPQATRLWFFCDELKDAGRLDALPDLLNARSKGVRSVLGFQDLEGLYVGYKSKDEAKTLIGKCGNIAFLHLETNETAEWASKRTGRVEQLEIMEQVDKDKNRSFGEHLAERDAVLASEFTGLPTMLNGQIHGIHIVRGLGIVRRAVPAKFPEINPDDNFWPRPVEDQDLSNFTAEDAARLKIDMPPDAPTHQSSAPPQTGPNLDDLGRITFT